MVSERFGRVVKGLGGLFEVMLEDNGESERVSCRAKGNLKRDEEKVLVGDLVSVSIDDSTPDGVVISEIKERKNSFIRPPIANLDLLFVVFSAVKPIPVTETIDKMISVAEHNSVAPAVVITKSELSREEAERLGAIYKLSGIPTFITSSLTGEGIPELREYILSQIEKGSCLAFAGASGVGKSTLMNALFPELSLATAEISRKIERGRHTTRHVELFNVKEYGNGYIADTPGFSLVDFERFDFMGLDDLFVTFRELVPYVGRCRYADCSHTKEGAEECAIARAAQEGLIAESRLASYRSIYETLKSKNAYK